MPNHVMNIVTIEGDKARIKEIMKSVMYGPSSQRPFEETGLGTLDFNKVIPMPKSLDIESGTTTDRAVALYLLALNPETENYGIAKMEKDKFDALVDKIKQTASFRFVNMSEEEILPYNPYNLQRTSRDRLIKLGKQAVDNYINYNAFTWYEWCWENWGTKWNSYDSQTNKDDGFQFCTAWSAPHNVIQALAAKNPDVSFTHEWADEDIGSNCGYNVYDKGRLTETWLPDPDNPKEAVEYAAMIWGETPEDLGLVLNEDGTEYIGA